MEGRKFIIVVSTFMIGFYFLFSHSDFIYDYVGQLYSKSHTEKKVKRVINSSPLAEADRIFETESYGMVSTNSNFGKIEDIVARGELVVCAKKDDNNTLFQIKVGENEYIGKDVEFAEAIAANLGVRLRYKMIYQTYDEVVDAIVRGEGDIGIAKISYTPERAAKVSYSDPYVISRHMLLINRIALEKYRSHSIEEFLNNKKIKLGITSNTAYESLSKLLFPEAQIVTDKDWENVIVKKVADNQLTATMRDEVRIKSLIKRNPSVFVKISPIALKGEKETMSAVIRHGNTEFLTWINRFIKAKMPAETVDMLMEKYGDTIK